MKKLAITCCALLLSTSVASANFSDIHNSNQFADAINYVKTAGYVNGYPDGSYKPENQINRAEFTKMIVNIFQGEAFGKEECNETVFSDVEASAWYGPYACFAKKHSIIQGYSDGTFKPDAKINFAEAAKIIINSHEPDRAKERKNTESPVWYELYTNIIWSSMAVPSSITWPDKIITRGEMAYIIWKYEGLGIPYDEQLRTVQDNVAIILGTSTLKSKIDTVDEFIEGGFKNGFEGGNNHYISIKSVTCFSGSCGFEGGGKWGITANAKDSENFFAYAGKNVDMIIKADSACPFATKECHDIKNVSMVIKDSASKYVTYEPKAVQFKWGDTPADVKPINTTLPIYVYFNPGMNNSLNDMMDYYLNIPDQGAWYGPFKGRLMGEMQ